MKEKQKEVLLLVFMLVLFLLIIYYRFEKPSFSQAQKLVGFGQYTLDAGDTLSVFDDYSLQQINIEITGFSSEQINLDITQEFYGIALKSINSGEKIILDNTAIEIEYLGISENYAVISVTSLPLDEYGSRLCKNTATSYCNDFGDSDDNSLAQNVYIPQLRGEFANIKTENDITYREFYSSNYNEKVEFEIKRFEVDSLQLPVKNLIVEIHYKDFITASQVGTRYSIGKVFLSHGFSNGEPSPTFNNVLSELDGENSGEWRVKRIFIPKSPYSKITYNANGNMMFTLESYRGYALKTEERFYVPVDYIMIKEVEDVEFKFYQEKYWEIEKGYPRVERAEPPPAYSLQDYSNYIIFVRNPMERTFPNTIPRQEEITSTIEISEAPGEEEPLSFSIYALENLVDVRIAVSDFTNGTNTIPKENFDVRKVDYYPQKWVTNQKKYGTQPEMISHLFHDSVNIPTGQTQQFWITAKIPEDIQPGKYNGQIMVATSSNPPLSFIDVTINVWPFILEKPSISYDMYWTLAYENPDEIRLSAEEINEDLKEHNQKTLLQIVPKFVNEAGNIKFSHFYGGKFDDAEHEIVQRFKQNNPDVEDITLYIPWGAEELWNLLGYNGSCFMLNLDCSDWAPQSALDEFDRIYNQALDDLQRMQSQYGLNFLLYFKDEPCSMGGLSERRITDYLSGLANNKGFKTLFTSLHDTKPTTPYGCFIPLKDDQNNDIPLSTVTTPLIHQLNIHDVNEESLNVLRTNNKVIGYYTTGAVTLPNPVISRFTNGLFAFATDARYVSNFAYYFKNYDDQDDITYWREHDYSLVYQEIIGIDENGWIYSLNPGIHYEEIREGVEDIQLTEKLYKNINYIRTQGIEDKYVLADEAEQYLADLKNRISVDFSDYYSQGGQINDYAPTILEYVDEDGDQHDYSTFDEIRNDIADYIIALEYNYQPDGNGGTTNGGNGGGGGGSRTPPVVNETNETTYEINDIFVPGVGEGEEEIPETHPTLLKRILLIAIGALVLSVLIVCIVYFVWKKKMKKRRVFKIDKYKFKK